MSELGARGEKQGDVSAQPSAAPRNPRGATDAQPMNVAVFCARYGIPIFVLNKWCRDPSQAASQGWRIEDAGDSVILEREVPKPVDDGAGRLPLDCGD